jgi:hypothetical protein
MLRLVPVMCAIALLAACSSGTDDPTEAPAAAEPAAPAPPRVESIGVPECDDYIARMRACLARLPAGSRAAASDSFDSAVAGWGEMADHARAGLPAACSAAARAARTAYEQHGCRF